MFPFITSIAEDLMAEKGTEILDGLSLSGDR